MPFTQVAGKVGGRIVGPQVQRFQRLAGGGAKYLPMQAAAFGRCQRRVSQLQIAAGDPALACINPNPQPGHGVCQ
ncbi:hypothetical protein D3C71_2105770 [compost metagenome]